MKHNPEDYELSLYQGNENAEKIPNGPVWWAYCKEWDSLGDGETADEAVENCRAGITAKMNVAQKRGAAFPAPIETQKSHSGKLVLRMSNSLHRSLALEADAEGVSLNSWIIECLSSRHLMVAKTVFSMDIVADFHAKTLPYLPFQSPTTSPFLNSQGVQLPWMVHLK